MKQSIVLGLLIAGALAATPVTPHVKKSPVAKMTLKVGDTAPDFTLLDTKRNQVSLHDFRGKKSVALAFYIFAFTGG